VLSFGYFSLHKQRKVTRSAGAKAFAVEVEVAVAVAFDNKQRQKSSGASSALRDHRDLHEHVPGSPLSRG
jgi:hypothetical protein